MTYWRGWDIAIPPLPKIPALPRIIWEEEHVREPAVTRASAIAALDAQAAMIMAEKASREDYILELRAKLKRAGQFVSTLDQCETLSKLEKQAKRRIDAAEMAAGTERAKAIKANEYAWHIEDQAKLRAELAAKSHAETCSVMGQAIIGLKEKLKLASVDQQALADAKANAESLERGLPAAVEAATAQLREELATARRYVCELITDRDAAKKERDEAVASAERVERDRRYTDNLAAQIRSQLAAAQEQLTNANGRPAGVLLEENEKLRKLSSEACAEREQLRAALAKADDERAYAIRVANSASASANDVMKAQRRIDKLLGDHASGYYRARDVVKELCRLRGIAT